VRGRLVGSILAVVVASTASAAPVAASGAVAAPAGAIAHSGRWLVDAGGRVVVVHGVNVPSKALPAYPSALGFGDADASLLASIGMNAVRLTVERYAAEPSPGRFDDAYVSHIADTVATLARHGILTLIDFHQDEYGPVFHDNGFPDWMTITDGLPNLFEVGFPTQYLANPALERAFDHLWANDAGPDGRPLQADDAAILAHVAAGLKGAPGLLGYELINEPWPGSAYPTCLALKVGCPAFDRGPFSAYYARAVPAVRAADPTHLIWYEPLVTFNYGLPTYVTAPPDRGLGFAFHDYGLCSATSDGGLPVSAGSACAPEDAMVLSNAVDYSHANGTALLETEFGATSDTTTLRRELGQYDQSMIPWMFWSYTGYVDPYASDGRLLPPTDANVNHAMIDTLARPYPQLVAGTPGGWSFDPSTRVLSLRYSTARAAGGGSFPAGAETDVAVPSVQYPGGYGVAAVGARVVSQPGASLLRLAQCPGAGQVTATISPGRTISSSC
jgi:endoglycosylceramidase